MSLEVGQTAATSGNGAAPRRDPGPALRAALCSGGRRIHVDITEDGVRLRSRVAGRLQEIAMLPAEPGRALVALLEDTARSGVGALELDGGRLTLRYRLAACEMSSGRSLVLTLLPSPDDRPVENLESLGLPDDVRSALDDDLSRRRGLILVSGVPGSGRTRTLRALAGEADPRHERLLLLSFGKTPPMTLGRHPFMTLDLRDELWALLERVESLDADRFVVPEIHTPLHATLALALSGNRRRGLAPIRAQDTAGALVKMRELAADRFRAARDLVGVLAQHRLPTPCVRCSEAKPLRPEQVPPAGWDPASRRQLLARAPHVRSRGRGCEQCSGSGYVGWTYLYEYLSVDDDIAERIRSTVDAGRLREELKAAMAGRGLLEAGWREALRGALELDELEMIPGPEVVPFRFQPSSRDLRGQAGAVESEGPEEDAPDEPQEVAESASEDRAAAPHRIYERSYETLRRALAALKNGDRLDLGPLSDVAGEILESVERDPELILTALTAGSGDNLVVHHVNVAVLAAAVGCDLGWERPDLLRLTVAALVHDAGLLRVPLRVVQKESPLGKKDEALRRRHAEWTEDMVRASAPQEGWLHRIVRQVHERTSGRGYPEGLTGDRIDPAAKILGLADALEARTHPRPGRPAQSPFDAIRSLSREHADDFDRGVFRALLRSVSLFPVGSRVALSNGSTARVASINPDNFYRPEVEIVLDAAGEPVPPGHVMDLAESPFLHITGPVRERDAAGAGGSR